MCKSLSLDDETREKFDRFSSIAILIFFVAAMFYGHYLDQVMMNRCHNGDQAACMFLVNHNVFTKDVLTTSGK